MEVQNREIQVHVRNLGPVRVGKFSIRSLSLFIGPNGSGKTVTASLLYICQKSLRACLTESAAIIGSRITERTYGRDDMEFLGLGQGLDAAVVEQVHSKDFHDSLAKRIESELVANFASLRNIVKRGTRKAQVTIVCLDCWSLVVDISKSRVMVKFTLDSFTIEDPIDEPRLRFLTYSRGLIRKALYGKLGPWGGVQLMVPAGRAGLIDSFGYLVEQLLLESSGFRSSSIGGIERDFLGQLVNMDPEEESRKPGGLVEYATQYETLLSGIVLPVKNRTEPFSFQENGEELHRLTWSSMVKDIGPLATLLKYKPNVGIVSIDEPECHLHPEAQLVLAKCFVEDVRKGKIFLLSTHSPFFAQSLSNAWMRETAFGNVKIGGMGVVTFSTYKGGTVIREEAAEEPLGFSFQAFYDVARILEEEVNNLA